MFGNVLLWLEEHFEVSSRVTSLLAISAGIGVNLAPLVVGQTIEYHPMVLIYLQVTIENALLGSSPTNIGIARDKLSVASLVVVSDGVEHLGCSKVFISLSLIYHLYSIRTPEQVLE